MPRVSVVIDTYNHERFIEQAILSVLQQDFPSDEIEIVVVDDGSTDRTSEIVRKFEPRLRLIRKPNGGQASAFNVAIPETRSEHIAFLDGDDWWAPEKLRATLDAFEKHPEVGAVGHGYYEVHEDAPPTEMFLPQKTCRLDLSSPEAARVAGLGRTLLGTSRLTVHRRVLNLVGPIPEALVFCADTPILTLSLALGGAIILDQPLCYYRHHSASLFAHKSADANKLRTNSQILSFLLDYLPARLAEFGVREDAVTALLQADRIELERLQLQLGHHGRWKSFQLEMRDFNASYRNASPAYTVFKCLVAVVAFLLPPRRFYQVRDWYSRKNLKLLRARLAVAEPVVSHVLFQRRSVVRQD
jgi:glycosyltransferase involved in cell wall biosynthesis